MRRTTTTGARFLFKTRRRAASVLRPFLSLSLSRARARARIEENLFFSLFFLSLLCWIEIEIEACYTTLFKHFLSFFTIHFFFILSSSKRQRKKKRQKKEEGRTRDVVVVVVVAIT